MNIDTAVGGEVEDTLGNDLAERDHHQDLGLEVPERFREGFAPNPFRLENRKTVGQRAFLHRGLGEGHAAPGRSIGLGDHSDHGVRAGRDQCFEGRNGERGGAEEDNAHAVTRPGNLRRRVLLP